MRGFAHNVYSIPENMWWKAQVVIFNSFSMLLALIWTIQLVRTLFMLPCYM